MGWQKDMVTSPLIPLPRCPFWYQGGVYFLQHLTGVRNKVPYRSLIGEWLTTGVEYFLSKTQGSRGGVLYE